MAAKLGYLKFTSNGKSKYQKLESELDVDSIQKVIKLMFLRPKVHEIAYGQIAISFYCRIHPMETAPTATFYMTTKQWRCHECERRGYSTSGNIYELIKFTYEYHSVSKAYERLVALLEFEYHAEIKNNSIYLT